MPLPAFSKTYQKRGNSSTLGNSVAQSAKTVLHYFVVFPSPDQPCSFMDAANEEVRYRKYDEKPGGSYKYMEYVTCNRREFAAQYLDHYGTWISHRYHTDWQDAMSDMITGSHHDEERRKGLFPCKCIVADIDFAMAYSTKHGKGLKV